LTHPGSFSAVADIISQGGNSGSPLADQVTHSPRHPLPAFPVESLLRLVLTLLAAACHRLQALGLLDVVMQRFPGDSKLSSISMMERWKVTGCRMTANTGAGGGGGGAGANGGSRDSSTHSDGGAGSSGARAALLQPKNGLAMCCAALEAVLGTCHKAHAGRANNNKRGFMPFCQASGRHQ
jgi:hypothetical protein